MGLTNKIAYDESLCDESPDRVLAVLDPRIQHSEKGRPHNQIWGALISSKEVRDGIARNRWADTGAPLSRKEET